MIAALMRRPRLVQHSPLDHLPGTTLEEHAPFPGSLPTALVHFLVEVPHDTPPDSQVWLSGNEHSLGHWHAAGVPLQRREDGRYLGEARFTLGTRLEFKATRGSWETVEKGPAGEEVGNWVHEVSGPATLELRVDTWWDHVGGPFLPEKLTGLIHYHEVQGYRVGLKPRHLIVYLPPGYEEQPQRRYPVLYMHDGQNLMSARTAAFGVEWGVDEAAQQLILSGQLEPLIIVGIYNTEDRILEYTPVPQEPYGGGRAPDYGRLLTEVIKPLVDSTYRTRPEPESTGLAGSSLGGLVSLYLGLERPDVFRRLGVISPSVWWAQRQILEHVGRLPHKPPLRIWLDMGTRERPGVASSWRSVGDARALRDALTARGWGLGEDLAYLEAEGAQHNEAAWSARIGQVLRFLYPAER